MAFAMGTPLLDGCVLAILQREDTYGYALTQQVKSVLDISESTLYPVLRRLQQDGCLSVYDQPYQGRAAAPDPAGMAAAAGQPGPLTVEGGDGR